MRRLPDWSHTFDQLGLKDHLGIDRFLVLGFCIAGPFIWNLLQRAPERIVGAVLVHPSGYRSDRPNIFYEMNMANWGPPLCERRADVTMENVDAFLKSMYGTDPDFVFTVTRDFVRSCETPVLVLPDDIPAHPYAVAMETALLAPNAQVSLYPWKRMSRRCKSPCVISGCFSTLVGHSAELRRCLRVNYRRELSRGR